jgi:uncharacterized membrane protein YphA (DoxX/SURF4 family)
LLLVRVAAGAMMLTHGIPKILNYSAIVASGKFPAIFGSAEPGLSLVIMAISQMFNLNSKNNEKSV